LRLPGQQYLPDRRGGTLDRAGAAELVPEPGVTFELPTAFGRVRCE
jgi:hypothetical protein